MKCVCVCVCVPFYKFCIDMAMFFQGWLFGMSIGASLCFSLTMFKVKMSIISSADVVLGSCLIWICMMLMQFNFY